MGPDMDPHPSGEQKQGESRERKKEGGGGEGREFGLDRNSTTSHTAENHLLLLLGPDLTEDTVAKSQTQKGETVGPQLCGCETRQQ